ncbi:hypothetical protein IF188_09710 [Microbacterium sp. NEAU-LLC]|uniref:Uncharacterized protein n=1 Tax=Microbacterium helvum TaxID=2773713 RepID=A0ABR8NMU4_9MICO|nr:hypothetical protein [Microbacterium helvum]MBD3941970.1 hypothetical protein [Microbacterium helvum]
MMRPDVDELEVRNMAVPRPAPLDAEWAIAALSLGGMPLDLAADLLRAMGAGLDDAGFEAFFRNDTGFRVLYARRKPLTSAKGGPSGS